MTQDQQPRYAPPPAEPDQRQWTPVAPPHPYATPPVRNGKTGRTVAILSLALGLAAIFTVVVAALYRTPGWVTFIGALFALVGLVLAIIALVLRTRPLALPVAGAAASLLGLILSALVTALFLFSGIVANPSAAGEGATGEEWSPGTEQESLVDWPANFATGGIVFAGPGDPRPIESGPLSAGTSPQPNQVDRETGNDILIYVDYLCPHCGAFEQANGETLQKLLEAGGTTVEIVPLSFLDRNSSTDYSSRAAGAVACVVDSQPEAAWAAHTALLSAEVQPIGAEGLTDEQLAQALDEAAGGLGTEARDCISSQRYKPFASALNDWVFANAIPNTIDPGLRVEGTPTVIVNGVRFSGDAESSSEFEAFLEEQLN